MTVKKPLSALIVASFLTGALPATARASDEPGSAAKPSALNLTRSIDRAAARLAADAPRAHARETTARETETGEPQNGGGGGHAGMLVLTLVTTAASLGGGYYLYKQMKKQTDPTTK
jgi:hypothetical protein